MLMTEKETVEKSRYFLFPFFGNSPSAISRELQEVKNELDKLYLPGEREARNGTEMKIFTLKPERGFDNDAFQIHFR